MILEVNNLSLSYGKTEILKNINFKLENPCVCSILGPNGIGKTTLIRSLLGLKEISKGSISIDGVDIRKIDRKSFYSKISYVKQGGKETSIYTALDTVLLGLASRINPLLKPKESDVVLAEQILEELHISHLRDKYVSHLSGGEAQMVFMAIIKSLEEKGKLIIFNTHYPDHALRYSKKTLMLRGLDNYAFGGTKEIITKENIENTFRIKAAVGDLKDGENIYRDIVPVSIV